MYIFSFANCKVYMYCEAYINKPSHQAKKFPSINSGIETYM